MSIDDITKWLAGNKAGFNNQGKVLDALRTAVEALEIWDRYYGGFTGRSKKALASIRKTLDIKETPDG